MMNKYTNTIQNLQELGYRITPQRREVIMFLFNSVDHPKAEDIYDALKEKMPEISLATIYNTLNTLKELGMIDAINASGDNSVHYDATTEAHDHLYCLGCNKIVDIEASQNTQSFTKEEIAGFQIVKQQTIYYGYCPDCQKHHKSAGNSSTQQ
jgi:Fur family peroxide stress response transcriptional regulator